MPQISATAGGSADLQRQQRQRGFSACSRTSPVCAVKSRLDMLPLASGLGQHTILFVLPEEDSIGLG
ncbi:hypothetical protein CVIRNUC_009534 [Coccomyxa viridis]|uniref:Uncharacterized protein n=1 Tax=Coccomyxa viridis TaxID=1274662 RepID=A0AAV1II53_9CHLO|nr:hypothetical protein CVIRNUC_009534 [Coccomyxa viridis]